MPSIFTQRHFGIVEISEDSFEVLTSVFECLRVFLILFMDMCLLFKILVAVFFVLLEVMISSSVSQTFFCFSGLHFEIIWDDAPCIV